MVDAHHKLFRGVLFGSALVGDVESIRPGVAAYWRAVATYDEDLAHPVAQRLDRLTVPTLALWGTDDQWIPVSEADELVDAVPGSERILLPQARHFTPEDAPASFAGTVASFIERNKGQTTSPHTDV